MKLNKENGGWKYMPYIHITTSKTLDSVQKEQIKSELGKLVLIIPGKSEEVLMVAFCDGAKLFYAGKNKENAAFVAINTHGSCGFDEKKRLTEEVFALMQKVVGVAKENMFLTISEYSHWGFQGNLL